MQNADPLRDREIRLALREKLRAMHADEPDTAIIDELSLCQGEARVDIAVVNGSLSGYEIKSDRDKLVRLPGQSAVYQMCFDVMTVVVGSKHVADCFEVVEPHWGIWEAVRTAGGVTIQSLREPTLNTQIAPEHVVQLLWKQEVLESLQDLGIAIRAGTGRRQLWADLVAAVSGKRLFEIVRTRIRARGDWRSGPTPFRGGDLSRSAASSRRSRENRQWLLLSGSQRLLD